MICFKVILIFTLSQGIMVDSADHLCHCNSCWTSLLVTGHVSRQFSGYLLPATPLALISMMGKMVWYLMISITVSNFWEVAQDVSGSVWGCSVCSGY